MEKKYKRKPKLTKRIFIAIIPDKNIQAQVRDVQRNLRKFNYKLNFVNIEQIHLTLKFLGNNLSENSINLLYDKLIKHIAIFPKFDITAQTINFGFPRQKKASVIYLNIQENQSLDKIINLIQKQVKRLSLNDVINKKERRELTSHITIARVKKDISNSQIRQIKNELQKIEFKPITFKAQEIIMLESKLTKKGPIYSIYYKLPLLSK